MHRLVIHENSEHMIGRCYCAHWEVFINRVRPIVGDIWIVLTTADPGYLRGEIIDNFHHHAERHSASNRALPL